MNLYPAKWKWVVTSDEFITEAELTSCIWKNKSVICWSDIFMSIEMDKVIGYLFSCLHQNLLWYDPEVKHFHLSLQLVKQTVDVPVSKLS